MLNALDKSNMIISGKNALINTVDGAFDKQKEGKDPWEYWTNAWNIVAVLGVVENEDTLLSTGNVDALHEKLLTFKYKTLQ